MPTYLRGHAVASNPGWRNQVRPVKPGIHSHDSNSWENAYCTSVQDAIGKCFVVFLAMWLRRRRTLRLCSRMVKDMVAGAPFFDPMLHKLSKRVFSLSPVPLRSLAASLHLLAESPIISSLKWPWQSITDMSISAGGFTVAMLPKLIIIWIDAYCICSNGCRGYNYFLVRKDAASIRGRLPRIYAWRTCVTTLCWLEILRCLILQQI